MWLFDKLKKENEMVYTQKTNETLIFNFLL